MDDDDGHSGTGGPSTRVRLAQLARAAALATPGVVGLDTGPAGLFLTVGGGTRVSGVTCAVAPGDGYDVALRLVCALVPLQQVGDRVRDAVVTVGAEERIAVRSVSVLIADVAEPEED